MQFKAKILSIYYESKVRTQPADHVYRFTKKKILFSQHQQETWGTVYLAPFDSHKLENGIFYTVERVEDTDGKKWFQITFNNDAKHYLEIDQWNKCKLMWIHKRYWFQKPENKDKIARGIIIAVVAGVILYLLTKWII